MSRPPPHIDWDALLDCWSVSEAIAYLTDTSVKPVPKRGRLQQLLARTQRILSEGLHSQGLEVGQAVDAVNCRAVVLLAKLLHLLQQCPSKEVNCATYNNPFKSVWLCVLATLELISKNVTKEGSVKAVSETTRSEENFTVEASFKHQMEETTGLLACLSWCRGLL